MHIIHKWSKWRPIAEGNIMWAKEDGGGAKGIYCILERVCSVCGRIQRKKVII